LTKATTRANDARVKVEIAKLELESVSPESTILMNEKRKAHEEALVKKSKADAEKVEAEAEVEKAEKAKAEAEAEAQKAERAKAEEKKTERAKAEAEKAKAEAEKAKAQTMNRLVPASADVGILLITMVMNPEESERIFSKLDAILANSVNLEANDRIIELPLGMNGLESGQRRFLIRECYAHLIRKIQSILMAPEDQITVVLGGNRGTGKTFLGFLIAYRLAHEKFIVLYQHKAVTYLIIPENPNEEGRRILFKVLKNSNYETEIKAGVWRLDPKDAGLLTSLALSRLIFIQDWGNDPNTSIVQSNGSRFIVSSPNPEKFVQLPHQGSVNRFIMPLWTVDELMIVRKDLETHGTPVKGEDAKNENIKYGGIVVTEQIVKERCNRMPGMYTCIVEWWPGASERLQDRQLENLSWDFLRRSIVSKGYEDVPSQTTSCEERDASLVIALKLMEGLKSFTILFASDYVEQRFWNKYSYAYVPDLVSFIQGVKDTPAFSGMRGEFLEKRAPRLICAGGPFKCKKLPGVNNVFEIKLPRLKDVPFSDLRSIQNVRMNQYLRPTHRNFESVDGFCVISRRAFDPSFLDEPVFVGFQVTVSTDHKVIGSGLKRCVDHVSAILEWPNSSVEQSQTAKPKERKLKRKLPVILVFVGGEINTITKRQKITKDDGTYLILDGFVEDQYVISLGSVFEDIYERCSTFSDK